MAVKVSCPKCSKVLNAPDAARGKAVKCPSCEAKVPVPAEDAPAASVKSAAPKAAPKSAGKSRKAAPPSDADFLSGLDLESVEDEKIRLCPKCGAHLSDEDAECPECGVDTFTGQLSVRKRRKLARKGAGLDTSGFWKAAWSEPWEFLLERKGMGFKLSMMLAIFASISVFAVYAAIRYCDFKESPPPFIFWMGVAVFFSIGIPGMTASLMQQIVHHRMEDNDKDFKPKFDMFSALANGVKYLVWPSVLILPFAWTGIALMLPGLCFPIAVVHMTRPYVHPAWLPWDMTKALFKNFPPCLYLFVMQFALSIPASAAFGALVFVMAGMPQSIKGLVQGCAHWIAGLCGDSSYTGFMYMSFEALTVALFVFLVAVPAFVLFAYPQIFVMRAIGVFGHYFKNSLDLVNKIPKHQPAGFWPRYLAFMIDNLLNNLMLGAIFGLVFGLVQVYLYVSGMPRDQFIGSPMSMTFGGLYLLLTIGAMIFYWAKSESSAVQGTLGMRSIGLKVIDMNGNRITFGTGVARLFMRMIGALPLYLGWLMAAFTEKKQTLHDIATKTQVVWEGD